MKKEFGILSEDHKKKISLAQKGGKNSMAKKIINVRTGKVYDTLTEAAHFNGYSQSYLSNMLRGYRPNISNLRFSN